MTQGNKQGVTLGHDEVLKRRALHPNALRALEVNQHPLGPSTGTAEVNCNMSHWRGSA